MKGAPKKMMLKLGKLIAPNVGTQIQMEIINYILNSHSIVYTKSEA